MLSQDEEDADYQQDITPVGLTFSGLYIHSFIHFQDEEDADYQQDVTSVGITFSGFESPACGIRGYEWALGSEPGWSDILPYTSVEIVMLNESHGQAQIHLPLEHDELMYASVRAHTGQWVR